MTLRRAFAVSTLLALLSPSVTVLLLALHVALEHDHHSGAGPMAGHVAVVGHGHEHAPGTAAHRHDVVPAQGPAWGPGGVRQVMATIVPVVTLALDRTASARADADMRSPPPPPTVSPPILRV